MAIVHIICAFMNPFLVLFNANIISLSEKEEMILQKNTNDQQHQALHMSLIYEYHERKKQKGEFFMNTSYKQNNASANSTKMSSNSLALQKGLRRRCGKYIYIYYAF